MKRLFSAKTLAVAAIALGAVGVASAAHARSDVVFSIGVNAPYAYGYVQPAPVYVQPQPVYAQPEVVYYGGWGRDNWRREEWRHRESWYRNYWQRSPRADYDHDGVPNRYDRAPANPYRR
jgi:hypothetical protein